LRNFGFKPAFVDALDPRIQIGAGLDQPLRRLRKLIRNGGIALLGVAQAAFRAAPVMQRNLARFDRPLGQ
jgi:hypothetical protein